MARLSKANLADRGKYRFTQEEVTLPNIQGEDGKPGSVLVRSPTVGRRDMVNRDTVDDNKDWSIKDTAIVFAAIVVDPELTPEEAQEFLADWPTEDCDLIVQKFNELVGADTKENKQLAGEFRSSD